VDQCQNIAILRDRASLFLSFPATIWKLK